MNASSERSSEAKPALVPNRGSDKQAGEDLWKVHRSERGFWSEKMLRTLARGCQSDFAELGLVSLETAQCEAIGLREGVKH